MAEQESADHSGAHLRFVRCDNAGDDRLLARNRWRSISADIGLPTLEVGRVQVKSSEVV